MSDEEVQFNVKMPKRLREDAKRNAERGELSDEVRNAFRKIAYGAGSSTTESELEQKKSELQEVRNHIDKLRLKRADIENEIQAQESRATRLEERIDALKDQREGLQAGVETLENQLQNGERMWPIKVKNALDVDESTAEKVVQELKDRNPELPEAAFELPGVREPNQWDEAIQTH